MPVITVKKPAKSPYPSLRTALWLYLLVLIGAAVVKIAMAKFDPALPRLIIALFVVVVFTLVAIFLTKTDIFSILGNPPDLISLIASLVAGAATWLIAVWVTSVIYFWLDNNVGRLEPPIQSNLSVIGLIIQTALIIPILQGLMFWAFIEHAASGLKRVRAILLVALLYAMFGLITSPSDLGIANMVGQFVAALVAALVVVYTDCVWYGVAIIGTFNLGWVMLDNNLLNLNANLVNYLGSNLGSDMLSVRWLLLVVIGVFLAFFMFQVVRLRAPAEPDGNPPAPIKSYWTLPLVLSVLFILLAGYGEIALRKANPPLTAPTQQVNPDTSSGSTIPPVPATAQPQK